MTTTHLYEYWGQMAKLWDFFRGDTSVWRDRAFYLEAIEKYGQPVLDVGCGTGRLLVDFLQLGIDIDGVDNSPEMLLLCVEKASAVGVSVNLEEQPMQALNMARRYRTILVPSSSFQLLTDSADARKAMARFHDHLLPGGHLVMPFMEFWNPSMPVETEFEVIGEGVRDADGATLRRWSRSTFDVDRQLESTEERYEVVMDGEVIESEEHVWSPAGRWYSLAEVRELYAEAGFVEVTLYPFFTWEVASDDAVNYVAIGQRPLGE